MPADFAFTRRAALAGVAAMTASAMGLARALAQAGEPGGRRLAFDIWRKGQRIGRHALTFQGAPGDEVVAIQATILVKLGPFPIFRYDHQAVETWKAGRFASLQSRTISNGRHQQVDASPTPAGVRVDTGGGRVATLAADALPLTHWNQAALKSPLFNPQTGAAIHDTVSREADETIQVDGHPVATTRYTLSGPAEIIDWYDETAVWTALRGKAPDGSWIDYRRST